MRSRKVFGVATSGEFLAAVGEIPSLTGSQLRRWQIDQKDGLKPVPVGDPPSPQVLYQFRDSINARRH